MVDARTAIKTGPGYERLFDVVLEKSALAAQPETRLTAFWPIVGRRYGGLMVVGRSVNGWIDDWTAADLRDPDRRAAAAATLREDAEGGDRCRMLWVTDLANSAHRYNTNRSAFWRAVKQIVFAIYGSEAAANDWPSFVAWSNLYKVAPSVGWNPGGDLLRAQRETALRLLKAEVDTLRPTRVLLLTGRNWFEPFADIGPAMDRRNGLVEGVGRTATARWVVAQHPMTKPGAQFVAEVLAAFEA